MRKSLGSAYALVVSYLPSLTKEALAKIALELIGSLSLS